MRPIVKPDPVGFHSASCNDYAHEWVDYISIQERDNLDLRRLEKLRDRYPTHPVMVMEDQGATDAERIQRLRAAHERGATYVLTSCHSGMSPVLFGQVKEFAEEVEIL